MKSLKLYGLIIVIALLFCACQSREEKALETIKENMNKTLDDFKSYEPIETKMDSLKFDKYGDTLVVKVIFKMRLVEGLVEDFENDYREAKRLFDIWDDPRMYNYSSYADDKRNNAYKDMQVALIAMEATEEVQKSYLDTLLILDKSHTGDFYGWRVHHKFRCNTMEGNPMIKNYIYFMDKKCEKIFLRMDEDEFSWSLFVNYIDRAYSEATEDEKIKY